MVGRYIFTASIVIAWIACCCNAAPRPRNDDGKYDPNKYNSGRYIPDNQGRYVHKTYPYVHVHDNRELGVYHHIHIPYDGGYGPYNGTNIPYIHDDRGYQHDKYTVSTLDLNPYVYDIPKPAISLKYGFPDHTPARQKRSIETTGQSSSSVPAIALPIHFISTAINNDANEHSSVSRPEPSEILVDSQTTTTTTTTTTTPRPRVRYDNQGGWRIIRQEEAKKHHKYDYLYLTENGIYAEEQGKIRDEQNRATGTSSKGYYEYTGDDGKLYRVHYTVGEEGFVPQADHLPTAPPIPEAIQRALDFIAAEERALSTNQF